MDSQFRCGKCHKPIGSKYEKCLACGSLGPHSFNEQLDSAIEGGIPTLPAGKAHYPADKLENQTTRSHKERYEAPEPVDMPGEISHSQPDHDFDDESRFPAGMRRRSPILDDIERSDASEERRSKKHREENSRWDSVDEKEDDSKYASYDSDSEEKPVKTGSNNLVSTIITVTLLLLLVILIIYAINNYDELTKWLASPTIPEVFKPAAE